MENTKRLFLGMEVKAPWPEKLPHGRLLDPSHRHLTLAFLGNTDYLKVQEALLTFPSPPFTLGFAATFDQCLFLPPRHPHVVAWHVQWLEENVPLIAYQKELIGWLQEKGLTPDVRHGFMPHVTVCRFPFKERAWESAFRPLPLITHTLHLYESMGNLQYIPLWSYSLLPPFEEREHTADLAYLVRGESYLQLYTHAAIALAFHFPPLLSYLPHPKEIEGISEVIMALNRAIGEADGTIGCPFKAVSLHDQITLSDNLMHWEMIVDV